MNPAVGFCCCLVRFSDDRCHAQQVSQVLIALKRLQCQTVGRELVSRSPHHPHQRYKSKSEWAVLGHAERNSRNHRNELPSKSHSMGYMAYPSRNSTQRHWFPPHVWGVSWMRQSSRRSIHFAEVLTCRSCLTLNFRQWQ